MIRKWTNLLWKISKYIIFNILAVAFLFIFLEGLSSIILIMYNAITSPSIAERVHTQYDEEIGWINTPDFYMQDMYGPGKYLKINSQSFRNTDDVSMNVASDKVRIVCSGDSFTFGYGVSNDYTWCQQFVTLEDRFETINLGLGGYGIDQSFLWYKRNSKVLDHDIHVFAFVTEDFKRMQEDSFLGYAKPVLELQNNLLVTRNVPVPRGFFTLPYAYRTRLEELNILQILNKFRSSADKEVAPPISYKKTDPREIVLKVFEDLQHINASKHSTLVFVYLPMIEDHRGKQSESWRRFLQDESTKHGWIFFDLIQDFRKLSFQQVTQLFIRQGDVDYLFAQGHYNEKGNAYVAYLLYKRLLTISDIAEKLEQKL